MVLGLNALQYNLYLPDHWLSAYSLVNSLAFLSCMALLARQARLSANSLLRPGFMLAGLLMLFFQLPLTLYGPLVVKHLNSGVWYATALHSTVLLLLLWVIATPQLTLPRLHREFAQQRREGMYLGITLLLLAAFSGLYLLAVPWHCTALYAIMVEPSLGLLVRELSVKLVDASLPLYAFSIVFNTLAPMTAFLALWLCYGAFKTKRLSHVVLWLAVVFLALSATLLSGAKGNLIPSFAVLLAAGFVLAKDWRWRLINSAGGVGLLFCSLVLFQLVVERPTSGATYPFGQCVARLGACEQMQVLLTSLHQRDASLGLNKERITALESESRQACAKTPVGHRIDKTHHVKQESRAPDNAPLPVIVLPADTGKTVPTTRLGKVLQRSLTLGRGLLYRAFVTPFQVSLWHYLYVDEYGSPSKLAYPLANRIYGQQLNMAEQVYRHYGVIFSGGDQTSTSTSPTSYLFSYPAYWGIGGLAASLILTLIFEAIAAFVIRIANMPLHALGIGLMAVACLNFILTDYFTVWLTHGLFAALGLLSLFILIGQGPGWLASWRASRARRAG